MDIQPIETVYNGRRFRSRLEARWALFFDIANIKYEYEPEGFETDESKYLPDFYLPDFDLYVEVKPDRPGAKEELKKPLDCVLNGIIKRLLILSSIPEKNDCAVWWFPFAYYDNGTQALRIAKAVIDCNAENHWIGINTGLYMGYIKQMCSECIHREWIKRIILNPINDKDMPNEDDFKWSDTHNEDDMKYLNNAYDAARMERFGT